MAVWSLYLVLLGRFRLSVVTRRRLTDLIYALLLAVAVLGNMQAGGAAQVAAAAVLALLLPLALSTSMPVVRFRRAATEFWVLARAAIATATQVFDFVAESSAAIAAATFVALARVTIRLARECEAIADRLHGLPHLCVLRARLTTAIATGC